MHGLKPYPTPTSPNQEKSGLSVNEIHHDTELAFPNKRNISILKCSHFKIIV